MVYTKNEVLQYIAENDVKFIKLFFFDLFGSIKSISIQPGELARAFNTGISFDASAVPGFLNVSESDLFLVPDVTTLSVLPWRPQHGRVVRFFCSIRYPDGRPFEADMRHLLSDTSDLIKSKGYDVSVATECEFYLFQLDENGEPTKKPLDKAGYCDLAPKDKGENVRRAICITLEQMGISPEVSHHEKGPGQQEVDFCHASPLCAADNLATFKTVVRTISQTNGLYASFSPKPLENEPGNGLHINISLSKNGQNLFAGEELCNEAKYFVAGILSHVKEITMFLNPLQKSYERFGLFEAPKDVSWSRQNKNQLIRIPIVPGSFERMELRSPDSACNQYTALSLIMRAGLDGIEKNLELQNENSCSELSLPQTFEEAKKLSQESSFVNSILPKVVMDVFNKFDGALEEVY